MKNVHLIPTDKLSRLGYLTKKGKEVFKDLRLFDKPMPNILDSENQHIYITSDEEITKETKPCWCINTIKNTWNDDLVYYQGAMPQYHFIGFKKIILTTDEVLIADGIQEIPNDFLDWFVKNPSCERVEFNAYPISPNGNIIGTDSQYPFDGLISNFIIKYKIIIPKEEPKQETLEEAAKNYLKTLHGVNYKSLYHFSQQQTSAFIKGAKSEAARNYWFSQFQKQDKTKFSEEDMKAAWENGMKSAIVLNASFEMWLKQFKNKLI